MDEQNKNNPNIKEHTIHTYEGDMANLVRNNEASVIKIALAEQKRREANAEKQVIVQDNKKGIIFFVIAIILIISAILIIRFLNQKSKANSTHEEVATSIPTLIPTDSQTIITDDKIAGREDIARTMKEQREKENTTMIEAIFITVGSTSAGRMMPVDDFLDKIGSSIPGAFRRSLDPSFLIGIYRKSTTVQPHSFIIFKVNSYDQGVAGAYEWERTLLDEFSTFFGINTSGANAVLLKKTFEDTILSNKDVRVLLDTNGQPLIYSTFINQNLYMISDSADAVTEAMKRLRTQNAKPL